MADSGLLEKASYVPRPPAVLFYHKSMSQLAQSICERCSHALKSPIVTQKGLLQFQQSVELRSVSWQQFPDGWPNLFIENVKQDCAGRDVIFLGSFHSPEVVFEQLSILYKIPRLLARSFTAIVPYFPTGTMEREEVEGRVATAKTLAMLLSAIPLTARGPSQIMVFDIHALQERFYFTDNVIPRLETAIPLLLREITLLSQHNEISKPSPKISPSKRAFEKYEPRGLFSEFYGLPVARVSKPSNWLNTVGDPSGHHVIIVDDLVMTGGTLVQCAKVRTAYDLSFHCIFAGFFKEIKWQIAFKFIVYPPNSIPHAAHIAQHPPFKILSLCDSISEALLGFDLLQS
ncbi:unnamed protein product [Porites evermanni]|uniref:Ribose-phosphate pyrophosphokinase N-terminal domain-containing protein n=1 Tax=Porites evermanni TaxID=104178 RepID=A0ABN8SA82_9CNID|nr:unnamed protein product [Porites evermanni]